MTRDGFLLLVAWLAAAPHLSVSATAAGAHEGERVSAKGPLRIDPGNPRWFIDGTGRAVVLVGSHTWANRQERGIEGKTPDFDVDGYLAFLQRHGHTFIRLWAWEHARWMQFVPRDVPIRYKPLPYARTGPGKGLDGKPKFDVAKLNEAYFRRLRQRVDAARVRGIYVGVMLFQGFSFNKTRGKRGVGNAWHGHPFHPANNVNGINGNPSGDDTGHEVHTLKIPAIRALQETYIRKTVDTLNDLDNVLWEIGNECHAGSVEWQYHMIRFLKRYEATKPKQHPVGMTGAPIKNPALFRSPADWISPVGRKYLDEPPAADGRKVVVVDTDHIAPWGHRPAWVWKCFLRGNHFILMDGYQDFRLGSPKAPDPKRDAARRAMGQVARFARRMDLAAMTPRNKLASTRYCLADPGKEYLVYLPEGGTVTVDLSAASGPLAAEWFNPTTGKAGEPATIRGGARRTLTAPFKGDAVLYIAALKAE